MTRVTDPIALPPAGLLSNPAVKKAAGAYEDLTSRWKAETGRLSDLEGARGLAVAADRDAYAAALRSNKADPGEPKTTAADAELAACRRRVEALAVAVADSGAEVVATVAKVRPSWLSELEAAVAADRVALAAAVDNLAAARGALADSLGMVAWLNKFPVGARAMPMMLGHVPGLVGFNGEPYGWPAVVEALRSVARPPAASTAPPAGLPAEVSA